MESSTIRCACKSPRAPRYLLSQVKCVLLPMRQNRNILLAAQRPGGTHTQRRHIAGLIDDFAASQSNLAGKRCNGDLKFLEFPGAGGISARKRKGWSDTLHTELKILIIEIELSQPFRSLADSGQLGRKTKTAGSDVVA